MNDPSEGTRLLDFQPQQETDAARCSTLLKNLFQKHYFDHFQFESLTPKQNQAAPTVSQLLPSVYMLSLTEAIDRMDLWRSYGDH